MTVSRKLGNYPSVLIVISLTVALFLIGFCGWIAISSNELIKYLKQNIELQVFIDKSADSTTIVRLEKQLQKLEIATIENGNISIRKQTKDEAAKIFFKETKENYKEVLGDNPFRDSFNIKLKEELIDDQNLQKYKKAIEKIPGVYEVEYARDFLKGVISNVSKIYKILAIIVIIFFLATVLLINNTIKLALYSQRFLIRTMQLVGATDKFIQKPFLINGLVQGCIAAIISIGLLFLLKLLTTSQIEGLDIIQNTNSMYLLYFLLVLLGPSIGVMSTFQSIIRYQKTDLDKLY